MKNIDVDILKMEGVDRDFWEYFNSILEFAHYNMDEHTNENSFGFSKISSKEASDIGLENFFDLFPDIAMKHADDRNYFLDVIKNLDDYEDNKAFAEWLNHYAKTLNEQHRKVRTHISLEDEKLRDDLDIIFDRLILFQERFEEIIEGDKGLEDKRIKYNILYSIIQDYLEQYICRQNSKKAAYREIYKKYGVEKEICEWIDQKYMQHYQVVWNYFIMKNQMELNRQLNRLEEVFMEDE